MSEHNDFTTDGNACPPSLVLGGPVSPWDSTSKKPITSPGPSTLHSEPHAQINFFTCFVLATESQLLEGRVGK